MSPDKIFTSLGMWCGEVVKQGLKIGRQGPDNFTEHDFYMVKNRASLRTTKAQHILSLKRKILGEG